MVTFMAKRNVYLSGTDLEIWDSIPVVERKDIIKNALRSYRESESVFDAESAREKLENLEKERLFWDRMGGLVEEKEDELGFATSELKEKLNQFENTSMDTSPFTLPSVNAQDFWDVFMEWAKLHLDEDMAFDIPSPTIDDAYRIEDIVDGKVMVRRIHSKSSKPSTFTKATIERAISRLNKAGGSQIRVGKFMPVLAQECTVVAIHPNLEIKDGWIVYNEVSA
jgi:hypothetical protein